MSLCSFVVAGSTGQVEDGWNPSPVSAKKVRLRSSVLYNDCIFILRYRSFSMWFTRVCLSYPFYQSPRTSMDRAPPSATTIIAIGDDEDMDVDGK